MRRTRTRRRYSALLFLGCIVATLSGQPGQAAAAPEQAEVTAPPRASEHRIVYGEPTMGAPGTYDESLARIQTPDGVIAVSTAEEEKAREGKLAESGMGADDYRASYLTYTLRHNHSLTPPPFGIIYSCFDIPNGYKCRDLYGYEEGGSGSNYDVDFYVTKANGIIGSPTGSYGAEVVYSGGATYEGCENYNSTYWLCDYWTPHQTNKVWSYSQYYWVEVLRNWGSYNFNYQWDCTWSTLGVWVGALDYADWAVSCLQAPFNP